MSRFVLVAILVTVSCGGEFEDCALGELSGIWNLSYDEIDGTCGPITDQLISMGSYGEPSEDCVTYSRKISADKCGAEIDFECVVSAEGEVGTVRVVSWLSQYAEDRVEGRATFVAESASYFCTGNYDVTFTKR